MANRADADCAVAMGIRRREYRGPLAAGAYDTCPAVPLPDKAVHHLWLLHGWTSSVRVAMAGAEGPGRGGGRSPSCARRWVHSLLVVPPRGFVSTESVRCNTTWGIESEEVVRVYVGPQRMGGWGCRQRSESVETFMGTSGGAPLARTSRSPHGGVICTGRGVSPLALFVVLAWWLSRAIVPPAPTPLHHVVPVRGHDIMYVMISHSPVTEPCDMISFTYDEISRSPTGRRRVPGSPRDGSAVHNVDAR